MSRLPGAIGVNCQVVMGHRWSPTRCDAQLDRSGEVGCQRVANSPADLCTGYSIKVSAATCNVTAQQGFARSHFAISKNMASTISLRWAGGCDRKRRVRYPPLATFRYHSL